MPEDEDLPPDAMLPSNQSARIIVTTVMTGCFLIASVTEGRFGGSEVVISFMTLLGFNEPGVPQNDQGSPGRRDPLAGAHTRFRI